MPRFSTLLGYVCFVLMASQFLTAQIWVGSTGTPTDPSAVTLSGTTAFASSSLTSGTAVLHYNILPVRDLVVPVTRSPVAGLGPCRELFVRYIDNGADARVTIDLNQVDVRTGAVTTLLTFDSDTLPSSPNYQEGATSCVVFDFDFADATDNSGSSAYYFEVNLLKSANDGVAAVKEFRLVTLNR